MRLPSVQKVGRMLERLVGRKRELTDDFTERWEPGANRRTLIVALAAGILVLVLYLFVVRAPGDFPTGTLVTVPDGASLRETATILKEDHVIRSALAFRALMMLRGAEHRVHAGDYLFKEPYDVFVVARDVAVGQFGLEPTHIRIPEGSTVREMAAIFAADLQRFNADHFLAQAQSQEGYLFPDTYYFLPNATDDTVLEAMQQNFDAHIEPLKPEIASSTHSLSDIIIMASILEREAYNTTDRKLIAGVLWHRIALGMPLQVDAPFTYSLGKGTFQLTVGDLKSDSPYNTYVHKGLPPTPIGNPSLGSIEAALNPTTSDYLYFLADKSGVTHYCATYACQLANKAKYF